MHDIFDTSNPTIDRIDSLKKYKRNFILSPEQWKTLDFPDTVWEHIKFYSGDKKTIPDERGLYIFVLRYECGFLPPHGYIMYIGITGNESKKRTLRKRYGEYVREIKRPKRYSIHEMLVKWKDHLYFYFLPVSDRATSLENYETMLLDALIPPFNEKSFSGDFGRIVKEAWK